MIRELVQSIRESMSERVLNPLPGAFIIAWCIFNWEQILIVFSESPVDEKFRQIYAIAAGPWETVFGPGLSAIGYALAMPWVSYVHQVYNTWVTARAKKHKLESDIELLNKRIEKTEKEAELETKRFQESVVLKKIRSDMRQDHNRQMESQYEQVAEANRRWKEAESKLVIAEQERDSYRNTHEKDAAELQKRVADLEREHTELQKRFKRHDQTVRSLKEQLQESRAKVEELQKNDS